MYIQRCMCVSEYIELIWIYNYQIFRGCENCLLIRKGCEHWKYVKNHWYVYIQFRFQLLFVNVIFLHIFRFFFISRFESWIRLLLFVFYKISYCIRIHIHMIEEQKHLYLFFFVHPNKCLHSHSNCKKSVFGPTLVATQVFMVVAYRWVILILVNIIGESTWGRLWCAPSPGEPLSPVSLYISPDYTSFTWLLLARNTSLPPA